MSSAESALGDVKALAASQDYFCVAGRWRAAQIVVVVVIPAALAAWGVVTGKQMFWIPLFGFGAAVADAVVFNWVISNARYHAAQLASEYDASLVVKKPTRARLAGGPSRETVILRYESFVRTATARRRTKEWHYARIAEVKFPLAELLYIRSDLANDERIREPYVTLLIVIFLAGFVGLVGVAAAYGWRIADMAGSVLVPALPVATWLGREIVDQIATLRRKKSIRELLDDQLISEQINPHNIDDALASEREALHGMQFFFRATQPSVPNWFFLWKTEVVRETTERVLDEQINDALSAGHGRFSQSLGESTQG